MISCVEIISFCLLIVIIYQDYKYRAVSWIVFPMLFIATVIKQFMTNDLAKILEYFLINSSFILINAICITIWFSLKNRKLVNISVAYIGWGDLLFFVCLTLFFSPFNFIAFYLMSLLLIVVGLLLYKGIGKKMFLKIPLAGIQAFFLIILLSVNKIFSSISLLDDGWIFQYILLNE